MCKQGAASSARISSLRRAAWSSPAGLCWGDAEDLEAESGSAAWTAPGGRGHGLPTPLPAPLAGTATDSPPCRRWGCAVRAGGGHGSSPKLLPTLRARRTWLLLAAALGLRRCCSHWAPPDAAAAGARSEAAGIEEAPLDPDGTAPSSVGAWGPDGERGFLKAGSVYQNEYMTLWNANGVPISVTLRVFEEDRFELRVKNLNSVGGGSEAWIAVQGSFGFEELPGTPGHLRVLPANVDGGDSFTYDPSLLDCATAFAFRCLQRMGGLLGATDLAVDALRDAVLVTPRAAALRVLWSEPVVLHLTTERELWKPMPREELVAKPLKAP